MNLAELVATAREMRTEGKSEAEIRFWLESQFPSAPAYDQPRYKCHACLDRRRVEIWHPNEVQRLRKGKPLDECTYFAMIDCSCNAESNNRFDPGRHCRIDGWESLDHKRAILAAWIVDRERIENYPNFTSDFAEFALLLIAIGLNTFG